jgi:hypothetical protein
MNQQNQSPLDKSPVFDRVLELIQAGEFNTTVAKTVNEEFNLPCTDDGIRRFKNRHKESVPTVDKAHTKIDNDDAQATTAPVGFIRQADEPPKLDDPDQMMRDRGLNPEEWAMTHISPNSWDGPAADGNIVRYYQTKFTAKKKNPDLQLHPVRSEGWKPTKLNRLDNSWSRNQPELVVIVGDQQAPFHDRGLHKAFVEWLKFNRPNKGVLLGDLLDFPDVSRHPDDPDNTASVQECLQVGYELLRDYVAASPDTKWQFLLGNHDQRIKSYIVNHAPRINDLARVNTEYSDVEYVHSLEHLMRFDELGIEMVITNGTYEDAQVTLSPHLAVRHGWVVRSGSGASALKTLEQTGYSIVVGHVHRQSLVYHTTHDIDKKPSTLVAAEAGCMCQLDGKIDETGRRFPSYTTLPDWQAGFCVARIFPDDGKHHLSLATYVEKTLLWEGQSIKGY